MAKPELRQLMNEMRVEESAGERTSRLLKENPMVAIGVTGAAFILIRQIRNFKNRGNMRISNYLIHTRLYTQGFIVSAMTLGIGVEVFKFYRKKWFPEAVDSTNAVTDGPADS
ncbi:HIG1 domain member 2A [Mactra antiquata]